MKKWRVLDTGVLPGTLNMAIDRALLLLHAGGKSAPTLRFYQWHPPAVSLGYFQRNHGLDLAACRRLGLDVVRRPTGGRAVLHLGDLTYALIAGTSDGLPLSVAAVYERINQGLLVAFRRLGINAVVESQPAESQQSEFCFLNRTVGAILYRGRKLVGSAQTWHGSSMLQHGSVILEPYTELLANLYACNGVPLAGIREMLDTGIISLREILGHVPEITEVQSAIRHGIAQAFGVVFEVSELSSEEWAWVREIDDPETSLANGEAEYVGNHSKGINPGAARSNGVGTDYY